MNYIEFATKIKNKYPQYSDLSDLELATKIVKKYPRYADTVDFDIQKSPEFDTSYLTDANNRKENFIANLTPKDLLKGALNIAPYAAVPIAPFTGPLAPALLAGVSGVSRAGVGLLEGESTGTALKKGAIAGAIDIAGGKVLNVLGKAAAPVGKALKESAKKFTPDILSATTSISRESIEKAINNPGILSTKDDLRELGDKARDALNYLGKKARVTKKLEKRLLKKSSEEIDLSLEANKAIDKILTSSGGIPNYTKKEMEDVFNIAVMLEKEKTPEGINQIVEIIRSKRNLYKLPYSLNRTPAGDKILKDLDRKAIAKLKSTIEGFSDTRIANKEVVEITKALGPYLRPNKDTTRIFKFTNPELQDHLKRLDALVPQKHKFLDRAENVMIKKQFDEILPGKQGDSRGAEISANLLRLLGIAKAGPQFAPLVSPIVNKKMIQALPKIQKNARVLGRGLKAGIQRAIPRVVTPIDTQEDFRPQRRSLEEIKRERGL